jgi:hypothetical protein
VNQSLIDDFLVLGDKIGAANFFWSFPSKAYQDQIVLKEQLENTLKQSQSNIVEIVQQIDTAKLSRNGPDRAANLKRLEALKAQENAANAQLEAMKFNDPAEIKKVKSQMEDNIQV